MSKERKLSRRDFLRLARNVIVIGGAGVLSAGCEGIVRALFETPTPEEATPAPSPTSTEVLPMSTPSEAPPTATRTSTPTKTLTPRPSFPTEFPTLTHTPTEIATPTPTETSTRTPTPEPTATFTPTLEPTPEFTGLNLEGFEELWNPESKRWEYVDVDNQVIAYWGQRIELAGSVKELDFAKHRSLFTPWTAEQAEAGFIEAWNKNIEAWKNREIKTAIGFEISQGRIVEKRSSTGYLLLCLGDIPLGTILKAPFGGTVVKFGSKVDAGFDLIWDASSCQDISKNCNNPTLHIYFKSFDDFIGPTGRVEAGTPLLRISDKLLTELGGGIDKDYQLIIGTVAADWSRAYPFTFENLLRDEKGRVVYISQ